MQFHWKMKMIDSNWCSENQKKKKISKSLYYDAERIGEFALDD